MEDGIVLVIGSAGLDIVGRPHAPLETGYSNPGIVRNMVGGVARNIAENLARLEVPTALLTVIGSDAPGRRVLRSCQRAGINVGYIQRIRGARTGNYMALFNPTGEIQYALSDFEIMMYLTPEMIRTHERLFGEALMIVIDAALTEAALETVFELASKYDVPVSADPTTPLLAPKLRPYLPQLHLVVPNASETNALCGVCDALTNRESAIQAARTLVTMGAEIAVVTLGDQGLTYADAHGGGFIQAINTKVVDTTGAGDAFTGAVIFGLLNDVNVDEAMRLGVTAASLTLESHYTVLPQLTQELLYSKLMI